MGLKLVFDSVTTINDNTAGYLFTTSLEPDLLDFLRDDFNFEVSLRLVNDLQQQLRISKIRDFNQRCKSLVLKLFTNVVLNYIVSLLESIDFDPWRPLDLQYNQFGKPFLMVNGTVLQFNSSSSNDIMSIVVLMNSGGSAVGIDLSHSRQNVSTTKFIDEFAPIFDDVELTYLQSISNIQQQYIAFNHIWTLKEAFTKLLGSGLNIDLCQFFFSIKKPVELAEPEMGNDLISEYSLDWNDQIGINVDKLAAQENKFLVSLPSKRFTCVSSVLRTGEELPVIVSIIHQHDKLKIRSYNIRMLKVISSS